MRTMRGIFGRNGTRPHHRSGFTLVELMVAMTLALVVLAGVIYLFSSSNRTSVAQDHLVSTAQTVRSALEIMGHEFRMAGYIPLNNLPGGAATINADVAGQTWSNGVIERVEEAAANSITFVADLNEDGQAETVRYALNGMNLTRTSWEWQPGVGWVVQAPGVVNVADNITLLNLAYTFEDGDIGVPDDTDGDTTNDREDVRGVSITLTGQTKVPVDGAGGKQFRQRTLSFHVKTRNMGLDIGV